MLKVNLLNSSKNLKSNCLNVAGRVSLDHKDFGSFNISECSYENLTEANISLYEANEFYAEFILQLYPENMIKYLLEEWANYIAPSGKIHLTFPDIYTASIDFVRRELSFSQFDEILRGTDRVPYKTSVDSQLVISTLKDSGFRIVKRKLEKYHMGIVAEKL